MGEGEQKRSFGYFDLTNSFFPNFSFLFSSKQMSLKYDKSIQKWIFELWVHVGEKSNFYAILKSGRPFKAFIAL